MGQVTVRRVAEYAGKGGAQVASRPTTGKGIVTESSETPEARMCRQTGASVNHSVGTEINRRRTKVHVRHGECGSCGAQPIV